MQKIQVRPGYVIQNTSVARGGVTYQRTRGSEERVGEDGIRQWIETEKTVDHVEAVKRVEAVAKKADYICRSLCASTTFGWFAAPDALPDIKARFSMLRREADEVNEFARSVGSRRRAHVGYVLTSLDLSHEDAARECARTVRETLGEIRDALRAGAVTGKDNALRGPAARAKGLDRLTVGLASEAVKLALESIVPAAREVRDAIKGGESPESAGAQVELGAIETALAWFAEEGISGGGSVDPSVGLDDLH